MIGIKEIFAGSAALSVAMALATAPSFAAGAKDEISIAAQHAELAASATALNDVHMHLHHVINCVEGPKGADFSKTDLNPCANAGSGAIPDSDNPTTTATLQTAISQANSGIAATSLKAAQDAATQTAATLKGIK